MISIKGLCKTYDTGTKAVDHLDLEIQQGEILALLGPNGAGKTSTIKILTTLSGFDDGEVQVAGYDLDQDPQKVRQSIGYVAQETGIDYFLTGRENLRLQGQLYRMKRADIDQRIEELAGFFELTDALDQEVMAYSGGMRRKLDIATSLIHQPKVVFLDEPTLGLDTRSRQSLWQYISKLNQEQGLTILLTTHYLEEADKLSNRVAIIAAGQIKVLDTAEKLKDDLGGDSISLEFETPPEDYQAVVKGFYQQDYIRDLRWESDRLLLYVTNGAAAVPKIVDDVKALGLALKNVNFARPTLDDVFIKYTGTSLTSNEEDAGEAWWEKWAGKGGGGKWAKKWQQGTEENEANDDTSGQAADQQDWQKWQNQSGDQTASDWQQTKAPIQPESAETSTDKEEGNPDQSWPDASAASTEQQDWQKWQSQSDSDDKQQDWKKWQNQDDQKPDEGGQPSQWPDKNDWNKKS